MLDEKLAARHRISMEARTNTDMISGALGLHSAYSSGPAAASSVQLNSDLGSADDIRPFICVGRNPLPELGRRVRNHGLAQVFETDF